MLLRKSIEKFQAGYIYFSSLKQHKNYRTSEKIHWDSLWWIKMKAIMKLLKKNNSHVIEIHIFYEHRKTTFLKVLVSLNY